MTVTNDREMSPLQRLRENADVRRTALYVTLAMVAGLIIGENGSGDEPFSGVKGSFQDPKMLYLIVAAVILSVVARVYEQQRAVVDRARAQVTATRATLIGGREKYVNIGLLVLAVAFALLLPLGLSGFWQRVLVERIGIFVLLALGLNVVVGLAGLLDLGYIAFYAIGAYVTAYFTGQLPAQPPFELNPFLIIPISIVAAMIAGVLLGAPTLRLRGDYLAIVTLGFGEIVRITAVNSDRITNGPRGAIGIPHFSAFGYEWKLDSKPYYYLLLAMMVLVIIAFRRLENSRVGRAWAAIREDEVAAAASGVPTVKFKLLAFGIGASTAGLAGNFYASKVGFISPDNFLLITSFLVLVYVVFGGMGSITGTIMGAAVLTWLPEALRDKVPAQDRYIYFGVLLVIMMIFRPQGLLPSKRRAREFAMHEGGDALGVAEGSGTTAGATV